MNLSRAWTLLLTALMTVFVAARGNSLTAVPQRQFVRGDANADGSVNIADAVFIFNWLFLGGDRPTCLDAADTDDVSGGGSDHNLTDGQYLLLWLFQGGPIPPSPGPVSCGTDPSPDDSLCLSHAACPDGR